MNSALKADIPSRKKRSYGLWILALPWIRLELPAWGKVLQLARTDWHYNERWADAGLHQVRCKSHGYHVNLNLAEAFDRPTYFLARYCEIDTEIIMRQVLRSGDQFIDGGANIGMLTLMAAHLVGDSGQVHAFEPNPKMYDRLAEHVDLNHLSERVTLYKTGLSNKEADLTFSIIDGGAETGTVASLEGNVAEHVTEELSVHVASGDQLIGDALLPERRTLMKLDVEGHEQEALEGFSETIRRLKPVVITEIIPDRFTQSNPCNLFSMFQAQDYQGYEIGLKRKWLWGHVLELRAVHSMDDIQVQSDILWIPKESDVGFEQYISKIDP